jgi:hypothetical protein
MLTSGPAVGAALVIRQNVEDMPPKALDLDGSLAWAVDDLATVGENDSEITTQDAGLRNRMRQRPRNVPCDLRQRSVVAPFSPPKWGSERSFGHRCDANLTHLINADRDWRSRRARCEHAAQHHHRHRVSHPECPTAHANAPRDSLTGAEQNRRSCLRNDNGTWFGVDQWRFDRRIDTDEKGGLRPQPGLLSGSGLQLSEDEVLPDERVLWTGHPATRAWLTTVDVLLIPVSVLFLSLAVGILIPELRGPDRNEPRLFVAMLFSVVGVYLVGGRVLVRRWMDRHTLFVVTDKRVVVLREVPRRIVEALAIDRIGRIRTWIRGSGVGTLQFGDVPWLRNAYGQTGLEPLGNVPRNTVPVFHNIPAAEEVLELVSALQSKATAG